MTIATADEQGLAYLATPYTDFPAGHDAAAAAALRLAGLLTLAGINLICPVIAGHAITRRMCLNPRDRAFWQNMNRPIMSRCDRLIVGKLAGWEESAGVTEEIEYFRAIKFPVFFCDPATLLMQRDGTPEITGSAA